MTEIQAAIAREQLKKLAGILEKVRKEASCFDVALRPKCEHAYYRFAMMKQHLLYVNTDIFNVKEHYITPLYKLPLFRGLGYPDNLCPVCEEVEENIVLAWLKDVT